jgi:raffinose/stachyose/melibiose transport system substrate-binding protein
MKWYKKLALVGLATIAVVGLAACQKKDQSADGKVTIEYFNQKTEMADTLQEMVKD